MAGGCSSRGAGARATRSARRLLLAVALVASALPALVRPADAIVVCQRKKNVTLRADACRKKETLVVDFATVNKRGDDLTKRAAQLDSAKAELGFTCPGDPGRKLALSKFTGPLRVRSIDKARPGGGCRSLDGNQAACVAAFENGDPFGDDTETQALSCFYFNGKCRACAERFESRSHACTNSCASHPSCADATRTVFAGGPDRGACKQFTTQADCEKAWHVALVDVAHAAASCYWDGANCRGCGAFHLNKMDCTNTCSPGAARPTCKDAARVTFAGGPDSNACSTHNADQTNCEKAWHEGGEGVAATCWFEPVSTDCKGCGLNWEIRGKCNNTCL